MLLRMRVSSVINNNDQPLTEIQLTSWWSWLENLNSAVNEALNNEYTGHYLIRGLYFSNKDQNNPNPLAAAFDDLGKLKYICILIMLILQLMQYGKFMRVRHIYC